MGARADLAEHFRGVLPQTFRVIDAPESLGHLDAPTVAGVQIVRTEVRPAANAQGAFVQSFDIWVIEPNNDVSTTSEDSLDDSLDVVLEAIDDMSAARWDVATRQDHPENYPAYKITAQLITVRKD